MYGDKQDHATSHDESASVQQDLQAPISGADSGAKSSRGTPAEDGSFAEIRQLIDDANENIDRIFDCVEAEFYKARIEAKERFLTQVFPIAKKARGKRAIREARSGR